MISFFDALLEPLRSLDFVAMDNFDEMFVHAFSVCIVSFSFKIFGLFWSK